MTMQTLTPKTAPISSMPSIDYASLPRQIAYFVLNVTDMPKAIAFYKNTLGLAVNSESPTWSELSMGVTIALKLNDGTCASTSPAPAASSCSSTSTPVTHRTGIVFNVVNAQKSYDSMKALGIKLHGEPMPGCSEGSLKFMFEDPFGNIFSAYGSK